MQRVLLYDTTLRDGTQREGLSLSLNDKIKIAHRLADFGVHYIEAGWPGSNPKDAETFARMRHLDLGGARVCAFGSTRYKGTRCEEDGNIRALEEAETPVVTLVGKSWERHVRLVLETTAAENLVMIGESVAYFKERGKEVVYDAEHFFDGFKADRSFALDTLLAAAEAGADCVTLCDTNGGSLPWEVEGIVEDTREALAPYGVILGIHTHDDGGCGVANSLAAVRAGCTLVQGTMNGYGERVANANLVTIVPDLELKMGCRCLEEGKLSDLTALSRFVAEVANLTHDDHQPFVGRSAFAHKGGIHVAAVLKDEDSYQHIDPTLVGNQMRSVVSELSGRGNIVHLAERQAVAADRVRAGEVLEEVKALENAGYSFEAAEASVELLLHRREPGYRAPFRMIDFMAVVEHREGRGLLAEATVKVEVGGEVQHTAAEGNGPVNALAQALRKALEGTFPELAGLHLVDYKVRILDSDAGTAATTRVLIDFQDATGRFTTVGASANIIEASWTALADAMEYALLRRGGEARLTGP